MGGVKITAIKINQAQKLKFGKNPLSNSWNIWDAKIKLTVPTPNNVNWMQNDTKMLQNFTSAKEKIIISIDTCPIVRRHDNLSLHKDFVFCLGVPRNVPPKCSSMHPIWCHHMQNLCRRWAVIKDLSNLKISWN